MIVLPYLGPAAARREQTLAPPAMQGAADAGSGSAAERGENGRDPLAELPMRLTYRTARVLEVLALLSRGIQSCRRRALGGLRPGSDLAPARAPGAVGLGAEHGGGASPWGGQRLDAHRYRRRSHKASALIPAEKQRWQRE